MRPVRQINKNDLPASFAKIQRCAVVMEIGIAVDSVPVFEEAKKELVLELDSLSYYINKEVKHMTEKVNTKVVRTVPAETPRNNQGTKPSSETGQTQTPTNSDAGQFNNSGSSDDKK